IRASDRPRTRRNDRRRPSFYAQQTCSNFLQSTYNQIVEHRDRIRLRPKPNSPGGKPTVVIVDEMLIVQPALDAIAFGSNPQFVPLPESRSLNIHPRDVMAGSKHSSKN